MTMGNPPESRSTISPPLTARITGTTRLGHTELAIDTDDLTPGETLLVFAWPPANKSSDVTDARATSPSTAVIAHPFGPTGRKVWARRP